MNSDLKVLQVIDRLNIGGAERVVVDLCSLLLQRGIQTDLLLITAKGELFDSVDVRCKIYSLNRNNKFNIGKIISCARICARYDVIHVHMRFTYSYICLVRLITNKKFTVIFHDHFGDINIDKSVPALFSSIFKPSFYIGVSRNLISWARECLKLSESQTFLLRNTSLPTRQSISTAQREDWVMVSNIRKTKNIEFAIRLAKRQNKSLVIYGSLFGDDYGSQIKREAEQGKISIRTGVADVKGHLNAFNLALHTSVSESGPLVLLEYLASGLPFLAYRTGEVADVIHDELPECFIDNFEMDNWVEKICFLENNPPPAEKLMNIFLKYFDPNEYVDSCLKIYQKAISY